MDFWDRTLILLIALMGVLLVFAVLVGLQDWYYRRKDQKEQRDSEEFRWWLLHFDRREENLAAAEAKRDALRWLRDRRREHGAT